VRLPSSSAVTSESPSALTSAPRLLKYCPFCRWLWRQQRMRVSVAGVLLLLVEEAPRRRGREAKAKARPELRTRVAHISKRALSIARTERVVG